LIFWLFCQSAVRQPAGMAVRLPGMNAPKKSVPWKEMTGKQKTVFVCKLVVSIISFGFIYPNLMSD
jgi:hypothetical protein